MQYLSMGDKITRESWRPRQQNMIIMTLYGKSQRQQNVIIMTLYGKSRKLREEGRGVWKRGVSANSTRESLVFQDVP